MFALKSELVRFHILTEKSRTLRAWLLWTWKFISWVHSADVDHKTCQLRCHVSLQYADYFHQKPE